MTGSDVPQMLERVLRYTGIPMEEQGRLELKEGSNDTPESTWKSIVAFANTTGGYVVFGFSKDKEFIGVKDADKIQVDIASSIAGKLESAPAIEFEVLEEDGKFAVILRVSEAPIYRQPVHFREKGPFKGAYKRIGSSNIPMDAEDIHRINIQKSGRSPDATPMKHFGIQHLDPEILQLYRNLLRGYPSAQKLLLKDDIGLLKGLNALHYDAETDSWHLTAAALLLFGKADLISANFPALEVQIVNFDSGAPTIENRGKKVSIDGMALISFVAEVEKSLNSLVPYNTIRVTPRKIARSVDHVYIALREALVNAIVHQDFLANRYIQIRIYGNRLEIENAGYSKKPIAQFSEPGSIPRNPIVARAFEMAGFVEKQGLGGSTMMAAMAAAGFAEPGFNSDPHKNSFTVSFFWHHFMSEDDLKWISNLKDVKKEDEKTALVILKQHGSINNELLREKLGYDVLAASKVLRALTRKGYLQKTGPNSSSVYHLTDMGQPPLSPLPHSLNTLAAETSSSFGKFPEVNDSMNVEPERGGSTEPQSSAPLYAFNFSEIPKENIGSHSQTISKTSESHIGIHSQNTSRFDSDVADLFPRRAQREIARRLLEFIFSDFQALSSIAEHLGMREDNLRKTYLERLLAAGVIVKKFSGNRARGQAYKAETVDEG